jgi:hypothetical protein
MATGVRDGATFQLGSYPFGCVGSCSTGSKPAVALSEAAEPDPPSELIRWIAAAGRAGRLRCGANLGVG